VELEELVELLALAGELDRLAGDRAHREGGAAPTRQAVALRLNECFEAFLKGLLGEVIAVKAAENTSDST
jgi:hypothetical protein